MCTETPGSDTLEQCDWTMPGALSTDEPDPKSQIREADNR